MNFKPMSIRFEPTPDALVLVIGGVVLNQDRALTAVSPGQLFEEPEIRGGIEDGILAIVEARAPEFDCAENLHALALSRHGNFRWATQAAPGSVECRVLPEAGFVGEDQRPVSRAGFFLRAG